MTSEVKTARATILEILNEVACNPEKNDLKKCVEQIYHAVRQEVLLVDLPKSLEALRHIQEMLDKVISQDHEVAENMRAFWVERASGAEK